MKRLIRRGLAPGYDVTTAMSRAAVREQALHTRPCTKISLRTPPTELGIEIGFRRARGRLYASLEDVVLVVAPPRRGKTALLSNHVIDAPGACFVTSTKPDIVGHTIISRSDRPVFILNPDQLGGFTSTLRWSPIVGCEDPDTALLRAGYLLSGGAAGGTSDRQFWEGNAVRALRCLLRAAAHGGHDMRDLAGWAQNFQDRAPLDVLAKHAPTWEAELRQVLDLPPKTRDSISATLTLTLSFMAVPALADAVCPADDEQFDVDVFLHGRGTLYLLGTHREHGAFGPLFAALTGALYERAKVLAAGRPHGRLDPPLLGVLDEAANICRVPLEQWTSDSGGRGIPLVIAVQSFDQLDKVWGEESARIIRTNAGVTVIFGGLAVSRHLEELSNLVGDRTERDRSHTKGGGSVSARRVPVLPLAELRELPPLTVLVLHRSTGAVLARVRPVWTRRDYKRAKP